MAKKKQKKQASKEKISVKKCQFLFFHFPEVFSKNLYYDRFSQIFRQIFPRKQQIIAHVSIFAQIRYFKNLIYGIGNTNKKQGYIGFAKIYLRFIFVRESAEIQYFIYQASSEYSHKIFIFTSFRGFSAKPKSFWKSGSKMGFDPYFCKNENLVYFSHWNIF